MTPSIEVRPTLATGLAPAQVVVIGTSAGGLRALSVVLAGLAPDFRLPILVVQHRSKESTEAFVDVLGRASHLPVREAEDKARFDVPGQTPGVLVAPPDYHLLVEPGRVALSVDEAVTYSRPSIDVLFESAADAYGSGVVAVLLTGANHDGARGLGRVKRAGGVAIVQDPHSAECPEMPAAGITHAAVDKILSLEAIADELTRRTVLS